jgi:protocatechuate 3,4-dioxygenase, beta subunit
MNKKTDRRNFLKSKLGLVAGGLLATTGAKAMIDQCVLTPAQTAGPFYPGEANFEVGYDLTQITGRPRAEGQIIYVTGQVVDENCKPIENANVEIWQACASGRYNNRRDPNPAPLDPNFKYWAEAFTNAKGEYLFKTIIPGAYPASAGWTRPPHIHVKASKLGFHDLVTQMYFKGNPLNDEDLILQDIPTLQRASVIVDFKPSPIDLEPNSLIGSFTITLQSVRRG